MNNLYAKLNYIGINVESIEDKKVDFADIEFTILEALYQCNKDSKIMSLLLSWASIFGKYIIVEKFMKYLKDFELINGQNPFVNCFIIFLADELNVRRFKRFIKKEQRPFYLFDEKTAKSGIALRGDYKSLSTRNIFIMKNYFRIREIDVVSREKLIRRNLQLKNRYLLGACWRADIITAIQLGCKNPYQISKTMKCNYETAFRIYKDYQIAMSA